MPYLVAAAVISVAKMHRLEASRQIPEDAFLDIRGTDALKEEVVTCFVVVATIRCRRRTFGLAPLAHVGAKSGEGVAALKGLGTGEERMMQVA